MSRKIVVRCLMLALLLAAVGGSLVQAQSGRPDLVTLVGTVQSVLGCPGDWQPECEATALAYDAASDKWSASFTLPAGEYEYKVALNGTWTENYGGMADQDGPNVILTLPEEMTVTFMYDHGTHWMADNVNHIMATVPGSFQSELGCTAGADGDWDPSCYRSWLQDPDGDGIYTFVTASIPMGSYEAKVALNGSWTVNFGDGGVADGPNIAFDVPVDYAQVTFSFDSATNIMTVAVDDTVIGGPAQTGTPAAPPLAAPADVTQPDMVVIPGTIQSVVGCEGDWQPDGACTALTFSEEYGVWLGTFSIPAGSYEYKVAINGAWDENYGGAADPGGPNVTLVLDADTDVTFIYDHRTHWVADSVGDLIVTAPGNYQSEIGCTSGGVDGDWDPGCLRTWLQDPDGDGIYRFVTASIPAGDWELKVAVGRSWDENYGLDGAPGGANIPFTVPSDGTPVEVAFNGLTKAVEVGVGQAAFAGRVAAAADIFKYRAHWVAQDTIAWKVDTGDGNVYLLHYDAESTLAVSADGITGGQSIALTLDPNGLSDEILGKFPHLQGFAALKIAPEDFDKLPGILKMQMAISATASDGTLLDGTGLQIAGVLDALYTTDAALGITWNDGVPTISVWAPTARRVSLLLFADSTTTDASKTRMTLDPATGVWSITGDASWMYQFYLFEVEVYAPAAKEVVRNRVTDPYSVSLSTNSQRSQIVDIYNDPTLMPAGWADRARLPALAPEDSIVYELHVRDFSAFDATVPDDLKGTYMAFTLADSAGMQHLAALAQAGLTHLHLLPVFDIATIDEVRANWVAPSPDDLAAFPPDSDQQQALHTPTRDTDGYNWGYDPYHFNTPEGSYATNPDGVQRIIEFRQMVMAVNSLGLRVVMDVVYNHTNSSGQSDKSVFDRIVPGYYHRLGATGGVETSTCCQNTASEHNMFRRFMVDSTRFWVTAYGIDAYRFDLMGHHMVGDMQAVRDGLDALTLDADGVDGRGVYIYGEGWNFGEVQDNARGVNATQFNLPLAGLHIGTFNDRLRDAVRGGSPFGGRTDQGFATGLFVYPNGITVGTEEEQLARLLLFSDQIRVGMAGNLRDYTFVGMAGDLVTGMDVLYNGSPTGYAMDPQDNIIYVSKHDNETFFDAIQYKAPLDAPMADRVRMMNLGSSIVMFSQGIPFFQAGDDLLRSKSLDRNSYNSGDWFNRIDWTGQINNWGIGLPPSQDNREMYPVMQPLLANPALVATPDDIAAARLHFLDILQIRQSSPLFRLRSAQDIIDRVSFFNVGPDQLPGVIGYTLSDDGVGTGDMDPNYVMVVVVFNANPTDVTVGDAAFVGKDFVLHSVQANGGDPVVQGASFDSAAGTFTVPRLTAAVFVVEQK